jgi:hypothetical protein
MPHLTSQIAPDLVAAAVCKCADKSGILRVGSAPLWKRLDFIVARDQQRR